MNQDGMETKDEAASHQYGVGERLAAEGKLGGDDGIPMGFVGEATLAKKMDYCYRVGQEFGRGRHLRKMGNGMFDVPGAVVISTYLKQLGLINRLHSDWVTLQVALDALGLEVVTEVADLKPGMLVVLTNRRESHGPDGMGIINRNWPGGSVEMYCGDVPSVTAFGLAKGRPCMDYAFKIGNSGEGNSGEGNREQGTGKPNRITGTGPEDMSDIDKLHALIESSQKVIDEHQVMMELISRRGTELDQSSITRFETNKERLDRLEEDMGRTMKVSPTEGTGNREQGTGNREQGTVEKGTGGTGRGKAKVRGTRKK